MASPRVFSIRKYNIRRISKLHHADWLQRNTKSSDFRPTSSPPSHFWKTDARNPTALFLLSTTVKASQNTYAAPQDPRPSELRGMKRERERGRERQTLRLGFSIDHQKGDVSAETAKGERGWEDEERATRINRLGDACRGASRPTSTCFAQPALLEIDFAPKQRNFRKF